MLHLILISQLYLPTFLFFSDFTTEILFLLHTFPLFRIYLSLFYIYVSLFRIYVYLYFMFMYMHNNHCHRVTVHLQLNILLLLLLLLCGTAVAQWLRCCVTNRKVAGSIPAGVSGFFIDIKSFRSHYGPGVDSASNRNEFQEYFLGVKAADA